MPSMPKWNPDAIKIAEKILGKPANAKKRTSREQWINEKLFYEETYRVR